MGTISLKSPLGSPLWQSGGSALVLEAIAFARASLKATLLALGQQWQNRAGHQSALAEATCCFPLLLCRPSSSNHREKATLDVKLWKGWICHASCALVRSLQCTATQVEKPMPWTATVFQPCISSTLPCSGPEFPCPTSVMLGS